MTSDSRPTGLTRVGRSYVRVVVLWLVVLVALYAFQEYFS
jgi:hypothetical protein